MTARFAGSRTGQVAVLLAVCALVYWPALGSRPFDFSEGHRVVPGWTMLETGDWWHVKMFGLTYLRKPPGVAWAIAASSALFGETEFAARAVSAGCATAMAVVAWAFAQRWFGTNGPAPLAAGLAQALMPLMWSPGRTAEIEMLNNLGAQLLAFGLIDLMMPRLACGGETGGQIRLTLSPQRRHHSIPGILCAAAGTTIASLAKGPAAAPVLIGVLAGACIVVGSVRPIRTVGIWFALALAAGVLIPIGMRLVSLNDDPDAVREGISHFLWTRERVIGVATLLPIAFASAMPMSLGLLFPFASDARKETDTDEESGRAHAAAWVCTVSWFMTVGVLILSGVSNPRYAMPAAALLPPTVGYAARGCAGGFSESRRRLASLLLIGRPAVWAPLLLIASLTTTYLLTGPRRGDADAGLNAARVFAGVLPPGSVVWADDAIEARPDVLLYARRLGPTSPAIEPRWFKPAMLRGELAPSGSYMLLRTDAGSSERARYTAAIAEGRLDRVSSERIRTLEFTLYRVTR